MDQLARKVAPRMFHAGRNRVRARAYPYRLLSGLLAVLVVAACDESFSPIESSALQFSIYGYLDASADTQWIRVMPLRPVILTAASPLGAAVTVEQLGTGRTIPLRDSVFSFSEYNQDIGSEGVYLHNYWTTEKIEPGASYRFSAGDGGPPSEGVVQIPPDFQMAEVWLRQLRTSGPDLVLIDGVKYLPFVGVTNHFYDSCGVGIEHVFARMGPRDTTDHLVPISRLFQGRNDRACLFPIVEKREVIVVSSGAEWPSGLDYATGRLGLDTVSNISNSMGFLGGVLTRTLPYESCEIESTPPSTDYCRLRYDASSATLRGALTDTTCANQPVVGATVRLREIDPPPGAPRRIRSTPSDHSGEYEIGALEGAKRYALSIRRPGPGVIDAYAEHTDTLEFGSGEVMTRDIGLERLISCSIEL